MSAASLAVLRNQEAASPKARLCLHRKMIVSYYTCWLLSSAPGQWMYGIHPARCCMLLHFMPTPLLEWCQSQRHCVFRLSVCMSMIIYSQCFNISDKWLSEFHQI